MNLFKKQKFSIRKFNIGIFSALIATVTFLGQSGHASANETEAALSNQSSDNVSSNQNLKEASNETNTYESDNTNNQNSNHDDISNPDNISNGTLNTSNNEATTNNGTNQDFNQINENEQDANRSNDNNDETNQGNKDNVQENSEEKAQNNNASNSTESTNKKVNAQETTNHIEAQPKQQSNKDNYSTQPSVPSAKATAEEANRPKKRSRRALSNNPNGLNSADTTTDPNINNTGRNTVRTVLTFDDVGVSTSTNRSNPKVNVVSSLDGFTMINGGKVGLLNAILKRTDVFATNDPKNYQAEGNVLALGRVLGTDLSNHGDFNGIEKEFDVNPNSELVFEFNTMAPRTNQSGTNLIIKNADNNQQLASQVVQGGYLWRLFKVPNNVNRVKVQFTPNYDVMTNLSSVRTLNDGYKYFDFIDNVGIYTGSHLQIHSRAMGTSATNNTEFNVSTELKDDGSFAVSLKPNEFSYTINLPEGIEYVDNSLQLAFPGGNLSDVNVRPFTVNYDRQNRTVTFTSNGSTQGQSGALEQARLQAGKILRLSYKLRVNNVTVPKTVSFTDSATYNTFTLDYMNQAPPASVVQSQPYQLDIVMNKEALQRQAESTFPTSQYTYASVLEYNKLKKQAQTILDEDANSVPLDQRASQATIDGLVTKMQNTLISRKEAVKEIENKAQEMSDAIDDNTELTTEEKDKAHEAIDGHKDEGISNVDDQTTVDDVNRVKNEAITTLGNDTATPVTKPNARKAINDKVAEQKRLIQQNNEATDEEKQVALNKVDQHSAEALQQITDGQTDDVVNQAKDDGVNKINDDVAQPVAKSKAREAINQKVQDQINHINGNTQATQEEKNAAIENVNRAKDTAIQNINTATTDSKVQEAQTDGSNSIQQIDANPVKKQAAINELKAKVQEQKQLIQANQDSTTEEKQVAETKIDDILLEATRNINNATTDNQVDQLKATANTGITNVAPATKVKTDARNTIEAKAASQKQLIQGNNNATTEERQKAIEEVEKHKESALNNIRTAQSTQDVKTAEREGINTINNDVPETLVKEQARQALNTKASEQRNAVNQTPDATDEEKQTALNQINQKLNEGLTQINAADTNEHVKQAKDNAVQQIESVHAQVEKKPQAKQLVEAKANEKRNEINQNNEGTTEEKTTALQNITNAETQAKEQIGQVTSNQEVENAKNNGINAIDQLRPQYTKKQEARKEIENKFKEKETQINQTPDATQDEKNEALTRLNEAKTNALNSVNQAQSNDDVSNAKTTGIESINNVNPTVAKKREAREAITNASTQHKQTIQNNQDATQEEKDAANRLVDAATGNATNSINIATTDANVDNAKQEGINTINAIVPSTTVKTEAKNAIDKQVEKTKASIQKTSEATDEEKAEAIKKVEAAQNEAKTNIQQSNTNNEVSDAKVAGINKISAIQPSTQVKAEARRSIQEKAEQQRAVINQTPDATNEEKQAGIKRVNDAVAQALQQINQDHSTQQVNSTRDNTVNEIGNIQVNPVEKTNARNAINQSKAQQLATIQGNQNSTDEEKEVAINELNRLTQQALTNVDSANTNQDVTQTKTTGIHNINQVTPATQVKTSAKDAIDKQLQKQIEDINRSHDTTTEEKDHAVQRANQEASTIKNNIQNATKTDKVNEIKTTGITTLESIHANAVAKPEARQALQTKKA